MSYSPELIFWLIKGSFATNIAFNHGAKCTFWVFVARVTFGALDGESRESVPFPGKEKGTRGVRWITEIPVP